MFNRNTMRTTIAALLAASAPANALTITDDRGGSVIKYIVAAKMLDAVDEPVIIDGFCASACAVFLGLDKACVTPSSTIGFHMPFGGEYMENLKAAVTMASMMPPELGQWYIKNGLVETGMVFINGSDVIEMGVTECE